MTDQEKPQEALPAAEEHVILHTYHSDDFHVDVKTAPKCRVTIVVKAEPKIMQKAKEEAVKRVAKEVSIPGFRKGKAPAAILESKYPGALAKAWDQSFADLAFKEAQTLAKIPNLNNSSRVSYQVQALSEAKGEVSFQFEREPEIPEIDYTKFSLPSTNAKSISDSDVEETLRSIQMFYARWEHISDRPVREGDFVLLDIDDIDQDPPVQAFSNSRFEVRKKKMADWMLEAVLDKSKDFSFETVSKPDAGESEEVQKQFQPKKVRITIKGIEEAVLPPIDEELAKKVGVADILTLRTKVRSLLENQAANNWKHELREHVAEELLASVVFEVPASMLEKEANFRLSQQFKNQEFAKRWKDEMTEAEKEAKKHEAVTQAEHAIRLFYICRRILSDNKIAISEEELTPSYETILDMMFADPNLVNYKGRSRDEQAIEFSKHMMAKAEDFIIEKIRSRDR